MTISEVLKYLELEDNVFISSLDFDKGPPSHFVSSVFYIHDKPHVLEISTYTYGNSNRRGISIDIIDGNNCPTGSTLIWDNKCGVGRMMIVDSVCVSLSYYIDGKMSNSNGPAKILYQYTPKEECEKTSITITDELIIDVFIPPVENIIHEVYMIDGKPDVSQSPYLIERNDKHKIIKSKWGMQEDGVTPCNRHGYIKASAGISFNHKFHDMVKDWHIPLEEPATISIFHTAYVKDQPFKIAEYYDSLSLSWRIDDTVIDVTYQLKSEFDVATILEYNDMVRSGKIPASFNSDLIITDIVYFSIEDTLSSIGDFDDIELKIHRENNPAQITLKDGKYVEQYYIMNVKYEPWEIEIINNLSKPNK